MVDTYDSATISVVIPAYNAEKYLRQSIDSVLSQTRPPDEIIIVDDGSTDRSLSIAQEYAHSHPEVVKAHHHPDGTNKGASASRNLGVRRATGKYVAFLDADDIWFPEKLEIQERSISGHPEVDIFHAKASFIDQDGNATTLAGFQTSGRGSHGVLSNPLKSLLTENTINASTCIVRKEAAMRAGLFSEELLNYEDWLLWLKMSATGSVYFDDAIVAAYRQHAESKLLQSRISKAGVDREIMVLSNLYTYLFQTYPGNEEYYNSCLTLSLRRVLVRAHSLGYTRDERKEIVARLISMFPAKRRTIGRISTVLNLIPTSLLSIVRKIRRRIVKV